MPSVQLIRRRLSWLLVKVIGTVVVITVILLLGLIGLLFNAPSALDAPSSFYVLEAYYLAGGSWEGVERLPEKLGAGASDDKDEDDEDDEWAYLVLLDQENRVLLDQGGGENSRIGQLYVPRGGEISYPYNVNGQQVGTLVVEAWLSEPGFLGPLPEVIGISFLTMLLTLLIGLLLMRRIVTPLADIMAAAQQVTAGDLSARASVSGPDDFRTLTDAFNRMVATLEKNSQERQRLLADIAHELRTPLSILRGRLEGILDGIYAPSEAQIARVLEESLLIEKLVEDLRLLTLAETRQLPLERQALDLAEQAQRMVELFAPQAEEKQISLTIQNEPNLPPVIADPPRIAQVMGNLLANALRYIPPGSHVKLTLQRHKEGVALAISDNGPGVPEADLPHLFDRFWRAEKSRTRASGGTGLGLAITKQLIEAQGGHIDAQNNPDGGLCVTFILPSQSGNEQ